MTSPEKPASSSVLISLLAWMEERGGEGQTGGGLAVERVGA